MKRYCARRNCRDHGMIVTSEGVHMKRILILSTVVFSFVFASGCQHYPQGSQDKELVGTVAGGIGGGLLGATIGAGSGQVIATGVGVLVGALLGNNLGRSMDESDRLHAHDAFHNASNGSIGQTHYWNNEPSGNSGSVRAIRDGMSPDGLYCREFQTSIYIDNRTERLYGTACRTRDGRWVPVS